MGRSAGGGRVANRAACALIVVALFSLACPSSRDDSLAFDHPPEAVILISLDTLRADYLNFHGYEAFETSPFIDSFARESVVFENAFVTQPSTLPSHMSLFTGLYPQRHGAVARAAGLAFALAVGRCPGCAGRAAGPVAGESLPEPGPARCRGQEGVA